MENIFCHTFRLLVPMKNHLNSTAYLGDEANHIPQFMTDGHSQQSNALCHKMKNGNLIHGMSHHKLPLEYVERMIQILDVLPTNLKKNYRMS